MVGRKRNVLRLDPLAAATMFVPLCQHRPVLLGKRGFEGESLESIHQKLEWKGRNENPLCQNQLSIPTCSQPAQGNTEQGSNALGSSGLCCATSGQHICQTYLIHACVSTKRAAESRVLHNNPSQTKYLTILSDSIRLRLLLLFPVSRLCLALDGTDSKMWFGHRPLSLYLQYLFVGFSIFKMMDVTGSLLLSSGGGRHLFGTRIAWNSQCCLANITQVLKAKAQVCRAEAQPWRGRGSRPSVKLRFTTLYDQIQAVEQQAELRKESKSCPSIHLNQVNTDVLVPWHQCLHPHTTAVWETLRGCSGTSFLKERPNFSLI